MRRDLSDPDLEGFLEEPVVAVLATYRRDGRVLLAPVWHEWRHGGFNVIVDDDVKARNARRDPRAGIVVAESVPPYRGVEAHGVPRLSTDGSLEIMRRIAIRYLGPERGGAYSDGYEGGLVLRIEPAEMRSWDFADDF